MKAKDKRRRSKIEDDVRQTQYGRRWKTTTEDGATFSKTERRSDVQQWRR
uniref:Uncharacterized protein n=1 Tax=Cucumis melo TaxID=3656 RepID=A0A9I9D428_CUCME